MLGELNRLDTAAYRAVAATSTPGLDRVLRPLTSAADHSKLWFATAAGLALFGGDRGRSAALAGVAAIGLASGTSNLLGKGITRRPRPDRDTARVVPQRQVRIPVSTSFPSGHSASAFAFAGAVARTLPQAGPPLYLAAGVVAYSRVHSGVHYPGDVLGGVLLGAACGRLGPALAHRVVGRISGVSGAG